MGHMILQGIVTASVIMILSTLLSALKGYLFAKKLKEHLNEINTKTTNNVKLH